MQARPYLIAMALMATGLVGCSSLSRPEPDLLSKTQTPLDQPALDFRVGFLPVAVDAAFEAYLTDANASTADGQWVFRPDPLKLRTLVQDVVSGLGQLKACREARFLPVEGRQLEDVLGEAWDDGLDLVVRPVLHRNGCRHTRSTDSHVPAAILWFIMPPFTWWIGDEVFEAETVLTLEIYSTAQTSVRPIVSREVKGAVECALDDFQQGFNLFNVFKTPSGLSESQWLDIGLNMIPLSQQACQREWIKSCTDASGGLAAELGAADDRLQKSLALVCGTRPSGSPEPRFAEADVDLMCSVLQRGGEPLVINRALRRLSGRTATRAAFLESLESLASHCRDGDRLVLYIRAQGRFAADGRPYLLFADADAADPSTRGLAIDDLAASLAEIPGAIGLLAPVNWQRDKDAGDASLPNPWAAFDASTNVVVLATDASVPVPELEELPGSVFISELARATTDDFDDADIDHDGWLSFRELADYLRPRFEEITRIIAGNANQITMVGNGDRQTMPMFKDSTVTQPSGDPPGRDDSGSDGSGGSGN